MLEKSGKNKFKEVSLFRFLQSDLNDLLQIYQTFFLFININNTIFPRLIFEVSIFITCKNKIYSLIIDTVEHCFINSCTAKKIINSFYASNSFPISGKIDGFSR